MSEACTDKILAVSKEAAGRTHFMFRANPNFVQPAKIPNISPVSLRELAQLRRRSLRKGVWFQQLTKVERGIVDLTLRCVQSVRSRMLERMLREFTRKLEYAV